MAHRASCRRSRFPESLFSKRVPFFFKRRSFPKNLGFQRGLGSMRIPVAQNFPSFQPAEQYAHKGSVMGSVFICAAGSSVRTNPGGRKAATALHSLSLFPILIFFNGTKDSSFSSHPTGYLPGRVN